MWWRVLPTLLWLAAAGSPSARSSPCPEAVGGLSWESFPSSRRVPRRWPNASRAPIGLRRTPRLAFVPNRAHHRSTRHGQFEQCPQVAAESAHARSDARISDHLREYGSPGIWLRVWV